VRLADARTETCGAKAAACGELEAAARKSGAGFATPAGAVVPFGVMDLAIQVPLALHRRVLVGFYLQLPHLVIKVPLAPSCGCLLWHLNACCMLAI